MPRMKYCILLFALFALSCGSGGDLATKRARRAERARGDIVIGAVAPWKQMEGSSRWHAWQGLELAVDQINKAGGISGRQVRIEARDDNNSVVQGKKIAAELSSDLDVVAVLGHQNSSISIATSVVYQYYGLLMLSPSSKDPELTERRLPYVFRIAPTSVKYAEALADFAVAKGYEQIIIYNEQDTFGRNFASSFSAEAYSRGINIIDHKTFIPTKNNILYRKNILEWKSQFDFDAIFISGDDEAIPDIIRLIQENGIDVPILGPEYFSTPSFHEELKGVGLPIYVPSSVHVDSGSQAMKQFRKAFSDRYGYEPDREACRWYDAMKLLAHAMETAGSTVPDKVSETLHETVNWQGVTGTISFDEKGDILNTDISVGDILAP